MKNILLFSALFLLLAACKNQPAKEPETKMEAASAPTIKYTLTPFTSSQNFPDANLKSIAYKKGKFTAVIGGTTYKLGEQTPDALQKNCANSKEGQHIHLIIDSEPYIAKYTDAFDQDIPDGDHYILSFLSRSYHESIKTPTAFKAEKVTVKDKSFEKMEPIAGPMLFYSRPKGLYTGDDGKKVMLDFYLVNTDMTGLKVEADINGEKHMIDTWQPYYIEGLPEGDNTIKLSLMDANGQLVNAPLNPVSRTFKIEKTPATN
ncbi:MAG: phosphopeptide-binding protein [Saprospiraceae bacterium]|uniref:Phosphopeptide-binding protein n=1 Tax=Candidatus Opimibacter skivensis TaxID=2982028 RepID=A0A9D7SSS3_9BACT|nr:phosphopeptide-binding protein [Candidatus Opimibacter skivensis]